MGEAQRMRAPSSLTVATANRAPVARLDVSRAARPEQHRCAAPAAATALRILQPKLAVGAADDPFEREADATADSVMSKESPPRVGIGSIAASLMRFLRRASGKAEPPVKKEDEEKKKVVQKDSAGPGAGPSMVPAGVEASIDSMSASGGAPLDGNLRALFEPRFGYDFSDVRVHSGEGAAGAAAALGARAFTVGDHVFFGAGEYQPTSAQGQRLIAHELTHTIQQKPTAARAQRTAARAPAASLAAGVSAQAAPRRVQRLFDDIKASIKNKIRDFIVRDFPPWDLITLVIGWDPIQDKAVKGATRDWIRAAMKLVPDGEALFGRLDQEGKIDAIAKWWDGEISKLDLTYASIVALANRAWEAASAGDILNPSAAWNEKFKPIFEPTIKRIWAFIKEVGSKVLAVLKDVVLGSIAAWAREQKGYPLLTFVLGKDPVTGEEAKRTAKGLIFAVLDLVPGGEPIKENLEKSRTIEKAAAWFSQEVKTLDLTWEGIKALFKQAWDAFKVADLLNPKLLFEKMWGIFGPPVTRLLKFLLAVAKKVLELIFEGMMLVAGPIGLQIAGIIKKAGAAFDIIVKDPVAFVGHLVDAVKKGIQQFAKNILDHLKTGLIEWLVGTLEGAGLVLPKVWDLKGILDLVLQILGISYAKVRGKLVKVVGEKTVATLEKVFTFVKTLVTEGPVAAWKEIVAAIGSLWDMVIGGIKDWAITKIVTAAITKLVTMFNPAGAIIQAIIATYNTIAFFVERIKQILAFVESVVDSILNIAQGKISAAANYVERAMARTIPVILGFLARLIGLGNVSDAVKKVITAIQEKVDKAIDAVIKWIVDKAKSLVGKDDEKKDDRVAAATGDLPTATFPEEQATHTVSIRKQGGKTVPIVSSDPLTIPEFIAHAKEAEGIPDGAKTKYIPLAETASADVVRLEGEFSSAAPADKETKRKALAEAENRLADALRLLLASVDVKQFDERFSLEGMVASFDSMPRQKGDWMTPDHQPQNSLLEYAADIKDQDGRLVFANTRLRKVAASRSALGVCINIGHIRHKLGTTYGKPVPSGVKTTIFNTAKSTDAKVRKQTDILTAVDGELQKDATQMETVAGNNDNYADVLKWSGKTRPLADPTIEKVKQKILSGEKKMRTQDLQSLKEAG